MEKRVLIVGSSRGIGKSIALNLAEEYPLTIHGKTSSMELDSTLENLNTRIVGTKSLTFDVTDRSETKYVLEKDIEKNGAFWGVVLSMGITRDMPFPGMDDDSWDSVLKVDLDGFYNVLKPLILPMIRLRSGGRIVSISSISGIIGNRGQVNYSAAKAGLIGASKALSRELASRKITVNCVAPGGVDTDMINENLRAELIKQIPMGRLGKPEEIASAVRYLFSEGAEYMTGQTLVLSGGLI